MTVIINQVEYLRHLNNRHTAMVAARAGHNLEKQGSATVQPTILLRGDWIPRVPQV